LKTPKGYDMNYQATNKKVHPRQEFSNVWSIVKLIATTKALAAEKGLSLNKNSIVGGWMVILPDSKEVHCPTPASLSRFVKEYNKEAT
jgi:hypothetical protein